MISGSKQSLKGILFLDFLYAQVLNYRTKDVLFMEAVVYFMVVFITFRLMELKQQKPLQGP